MSESSWMLVLAVLLLLVAGVVVGMLMPGYMPAGAVGGGGVGGLGVILGPMRMPAMTTPLEWIGGHLESFLGFLIGCETDGCVVTNQPVGGGGGGGWPSCGTCNISGPPGTTAGGGGGWVHKAMPWNWLTYSAEAK